MEAILIESRVTDEFFVYFEKDGKFVEGGFTFRSRRKARKFAFSHKKALEACDMREMV